MRFELRLILEFEFIFWNEISLLVTVTMLKDTVKIGGARVKIEGNKRLMMFEIVSIHENIDFIVFLE